MSKKLLTKSSIFEKQLKNSESYDKSIESDYEPKSTSYFAYLISLYKFIKEYWFH